LLLQQPVSTQKHHTEDVTTVTPIARDVVVAAGPDTAMFLQGQLSQDVESLAVGEGAMSFLLQPQGKVDAWLRVFRAADDRFELDLDPGFGEAVVARLNRFKLRTKCELTLEASVPVLAVRGETPAGGRSTWWPGIEGSDLFGDVAPPAGATELDRDGYEQLRIEHAVPVMGAELTEDTIPAEAGEWVVATSVSFTKGCFTGQELVARIDSRGGNVPRHLRVLDVDGPPPAPGTELFLDGEVVGRVTSSAGPRALAYVKRSVGPPATVTLGESGSGTPAAIRSA
jgi:folate-binding protein YgfZ